MRSLIAGALALGVYTAPAHAAAPPIKHVFVIVLENQNASTTFGPSPPAPYLAKTLTAAGAFVGNYYATGHASLDNYVAMISGQAPNPTTQGDCPFYSDVQPGTPTSDGQVLGSGCVYPAAVKTLADQLAASGQTWRGYMEDMGADPTREPATCAHPSLNSPDNTQSASTADQYAMRHNPFVYFHSIIDNTQLCNASVVNLNRLPGDLATAATTPNFSFITPDLCNDGHDASCADGGPGGYPAIDAFLSLWVPRIIASPAFQADGLLAVIFDEASTSDASACCGELAGPNSLMPGLGGPGGGRTGAVLLSRYIAPGTVSTSSYNHYSLLRTYEDIFHVDHLGYAARGDLAPLGSDVFTAAGAPPVPVGTPTPRGRVPGRFRRQACRAARLPRARKGRLPRGSVIRSVRVTRRRGRARLTLRAVRGARLLVRVTSSRTPHGRRVGPRHVNGCRRYSIALPFGHGRVSVRARVGRAGELVVRRY